MKKNIILILLVLFTSRLDLSGKEARYWEKLAGGEIQCLLCPRACIIQDGKTGVCTVRRNEAGKLISLVYAKPAAVNIDPIEKKPLFHFLPGSETLSIATPGCNLRCVFCQNWSLSQALPGEVETQDLMPEDAVKLAQEKNCPSISYTYSEPTIFYEYMYDTAWFARQHKIKNIWISCGYINPEPLKKLCEVIDAANIDLKGFTNKVYRWVAGAKLDPVLETLKILKQKGVWVEVGYLVIPTVNDGLEDMNAMLDWFMKNMGPDVPLHLLRFFPQNKLTNLPPTPISTLETFYNLARQKGVHYVYLGNVPGHKANNTYCPKCGKLIIERQGYFLKAFNLVKGKCNFCGQKIPGVW